ncbi:MULTISPECIES: hypothetical protein [Vibrio]|nr:MULTISPECIES: hypothetical protein [unclassified Vibrio]
MVEFYCEAIFRIVKLAHQANGKLSTWWQNKPRNVQIFASFIPD